MVSNVSSIEKSGEPRITLTLDQIFHYEKNPRRSRNPLYDDIKESIRVGRGLLMPLMVTQRPSQAHYILSAGGNTRLTALKELYQETGDECFFIQDCGYEPWVSELKIMNNHYIENSKRADLSFIDTAHFVFSFKAEVEKKIGRALSLNELGKLVNNETSFPELEGTVINLKGHGVSRKRLPLLEFAHHILVPIIPTAQEMLQPYQARAIKKMYDAYRTYVASIPDDIPFGLIFSNAMSEHDDEELDLKAVRKTLDRSLAEAAGKSIGEVRMGVDALLFNARAVDDDEIDSEITPPPKYLHLENAAESGQPPQLKLVPNASSPDSNNDLGAFTEHGAAPSGGALPPTHAGEGSGTCIQPPKPAERVNQHSIGQQPSDGPAPTLADLPGKRQGCRKLAADFIDSLPIYLPLTAWEHGYGFYIDLPNTAIQSELQYNLFWLLVSISEQHASGERMKLAQAMRFAKYLLNGEEQNAYRVVGRPAQVADLGRIVLCANGFENASLLKLFTLISECRLIRQGFRESDIWPCLTIEQIKLHNQMKAAGVS